jgi:hypothetical protein
MIVFKKFEIQIFKYDFFIQNNIDMEQIGDITVTPDTQYWTYIINGKSWEKLLEYIQETDAPYIMSFKKADIVKGDIICVYVTKSKNSCVGYIAIIQAHKNITENKDKKIKIFKDDVANKFCVKIRVFTLLQKVFGMNTISGYLTGDPYFKSVNGFRSKYIKGDLMFVKMPVSIGKKIVTGLYKLSDNYEETSIKEEQEKTEKKQKQGKKDEKKKTIVYVVKKNNNISSDDYSVDDFDIVENTSDTDCDLLECVSLEKNDTVAPMIPILFDPCDNFRWHDECNNDKDFIREFKKHYVKCKDCKRTNNNEKDIDIDSYNCDIEFEIACGNEFQKLLSAYDSGQEYNIGEYDCDFIKLYLIDNKSHYYNRSIVIDWGIKIVEYTKAHVKESKESKKSKESKCKKNIKLT